MLCTDILYEHVFPKCSIDQRLALGVPPRKIDMSPFEHNHSLKWRYDRNKLPDEHIPWQEDVVVPIWKHGKRSDGSPAQYFIITSIFRIYEDSCYNSNLRAYLVFRRYDKTLNRTGKVVINSSPYGVAYDMRVIKNA